LPWTEWNRIGMAIFRATGGSEDGFESFGRLSQRSAKYNARTTRARWEHYFRSPPERIGIGSLIYPAKPTEPNLAQRRGQNHGEGGEKMLGCDFLRTLGNGPPGGAGGRRAHNKKESAGMARERGAGPSGF